MIQIVICVRLDTTSPDVTWNFAPIGIWAAAEVNLAVMACKCACYDDVSVLNDLSLACLPSLRPIWRLLTTGSLKSLQISQQSAQSRTGNSTKAFRNPYSESTIQFADTDSHRNRSFTEAMVDASCHSTESTCEAENIALGQMRQMQDVIMVKDEVSVKISGPTS